MLKGSPRNQFCRSSTSCRTAAGASSWSFTPRPSHLRRWARLAQVRTWIDVHQDQAIVIGSLVVGAWLPGNSIYLIVS